ncbi:MAG: sigma-70 family RNA polymerase sigma factor [Acidimicrobiia bacterium]|nr:sigma-70 family RNA polymerase sigma factor [Acidimicrobiia bacterium]
MATAALEPPVRDLPHSAPETSAETQAGWQNQFIADNLRRIFLQIYRIVGNATDAQDLTQEVFIKALQRSSQIQDPAKAAHWLSRIASNTAIDFLRRHARTSFSDLEHLPESLAVARQESAEQRLLRQEQRGLLEQGLNTLSDRERTALLLRDVEDLPAEEVARLMNCSKATVRSHIANARIKFRRFLERRQS